MDAELQILDAFLSAHPAEAARLIEQLPADEVAALFEHLAGDGVVPALQHMTPVAASRCLLAMDAERAATLVAALPFEASVDLLRRTDASDRRVLLEALDPGVAASLSRLLAYEESTAGAWMDPQVHTLPDDVTVAEAVGLVQRFPETVYYYLFVLDRARRLEGVLDLRELLLAPPANPLRAVMQRPVISLNARAGLRDVITHPAWRDFDALPVVDDQGTFLGVLRHRRVRELVQEVDHEMRNRAGVATLLSLGEIYWLGLAGLLEGVASTVSATVTPDNARGARDA